eukprot:3234380-Rhodomonas_salina.1
MSVPQGISLRVCAYVPMQRREIAYVTMHSDKACLATHRRDTAYELRVGHCTVLGERRGTAHALQLPTLPSAPPHPRHRCTPQYRATSPPTLPPPHPRQRTLALYCTCRLRTPAQYCTSSPYDNAELHFPS